MQESRGRSLGRKIPWRKKWQPTLVFLPGEFHGERRAAVHGVAESTTTDRLTQGLRRKEALGKERGKTDGKTLKVECHLKGLYPQSI